MELFCSTYRWEAEEAGGHVRRGGASYLCEVFLVYNRSSNTSRLGSNLTPHPSAVPAINEQTEDVVALNSPLNVFCSYYLF